MRRFLYILAQFEIFAICGVLLGAFWMQFGEWEFPGPLCIIQRMAMMLCALGPALIVMDGLREREVPLPTVLAGYGMSVLGAIVGLAASARQILLHIMPGDAGYGGTVAGMHLYTWALIVFLVVLAFSGTRLVVFHALRPQRGEGRGTALFVLWLFGLIIAANAIAVFFEAGLNWYLPDNPTQYLLIDGP